MSLLEEGYFTNQRLFELFLVELIIYFSLWFYYPFLAQIISMIVIFITVGVLVVSAISELIEPSKVPSAFFKAMFLGILSPLVAWGVMTLIGGQPIFSL